MQIFDSYNNIKLKISTFSTDINKKLDTSDFLFDAFLETSALDVVFMDQQLPFTPLSFTNDTLSLRNMYKANFVFNVYAENRKQVYDNYLKLQQLLQVIKPEYDVINYQYIPRQINLTGLIGVSFKGIPRIVGTKKGDSGDPDNLKLHLTNFAFTTNQDMGFIEAPYDFYENDNNNAFATNTYYKNSNMQLLPISYKLSIAGKVLLDFSDTAWTPDSKSIAPKSAATIQDAIRNQKTKILSETPEDVRIVAQAVLDLYAVSLKDAPISLVNIKDPARLQAILADAKKMLDKEIFSIGLNGGQRQADFSSDKLADPANGYLLSRANKNAKFIYLQDKQ